MNKNKNTEGSNSTNQLSESSDNDFSDTTVRMFNEIEETIWQVGSKVRSAEERMSAEMRKPWAEMKSVVGDFKQ